MSLCGLTYDDLSFFCRSPVRTPPRRRVYSRSPSLSPRRRRRSFSPDRPSRAPRVVHSTARRSYSRSPIRRRKPPPTYRSPVRRRYSSRSPHARRSSSHSLSPVPRSRARLLLGMPVYKSAVDGSSDCFSAILGEYFHTVQYYVILKSICHQEDTDVVS